VCNIAVSSLFSCTNCSNHFTDLGVMACPIPHGMLRKVCPMQQKLFGSPSQTHPDKKSCSLTRPRRLAGLGFVKQKIVEIVSTKEFARTFYQIFLDMSPASKHRFKDLKAQRNALAGAISYIVAKTRKQISIEFMASLAQKHQRLNIGYREFFMFSKTLIIVLIIKLSEYNVDETDKKTVLDQIRDNINLLREHIVNVETGLHHAREDVIIQQTNKSSCTIL